jgi:peptide/nickel transport system substrate-binding protein
MIDRKTKLRVRRNVRKGKRQVEDIGIQAEEQLERLFIRRLHRLIAVRRFVFSWLLIVVLLISISIFQFQALGQHYKKTVPAPGGVLTEGVLGSFTNANPLFATGGVDGGVSRLLFSSLFEYDENGALVGDIATKWNVNETGKEYHVTIRNDVMWHDGTPLTVDDIVFTYNTIKNPDTGSPLFSSWRDVKISSVNDQTISFILPNVFAAFPHSLTNGIVPKHILENLSADQLRSDQFNTLSPVGSGPFTFEAVEVSGVTPEERQEQIALRRYESYHRGAPKLQRFIIKTYRNEMTMLERFEARELTAMSGLSSVPDTLNSDFFQEFNVPLTGAVMVFFKTSEGILKDPVVRRALVESVDVSQIVTELPYPTLQVDAPLLRGQLGYDKDITQLDYDAEKAKARLDEAGWKLNKQGVRTKGDQELTFSIKAPTGSEYTQVTRNLQEYWRSIGVVVDVDQPSDSELQSIVSLHQYEAVLYSISIGKDPDVFAFWHSSQADVRAENRLNLSEYKSTVADQALEGGRTRTDPTLRAVKYKPFLESWRDDAPALALYQPRLLYIARNDLQSFDARTLHSSNDRYNRAHLWTVKQQDVFKYD